MYNSNFKTLSEGEIRLFQGLCALARRDHNPEITLPYETFKRALTAKGNINRACSKLLTLRYDRKIGPSRIQQVNVFAKLENIAGESEVIFTFTDSFYYILLSSEFSDIENYLSLRGHYSQSLHSILSPDKKAKYKMFKMEEFYYLLGVSEKYNTRELTRRIVQPAVQKVGELEDFSGLEYAYLKQGKKTTGIVFQWRGKEEQKKTKKLSETMYLDEDYD